MGSVQSEIAGIKAEQERLERLGETSAAEQARVDRQLAESSQLLGVYKEELSQQLETHQRSVQDLVAQSVSDALGRRKAEQEERLDKQLADQAEVERKARD